MCTCCVQNEFPLAQHMSENRGSTGLSRKPPWTFEPKTLLERNKPYRLNSSRPIIRYTRPARTHTNARSYILPARPTLHFSPPRTPFHLPFNKFNCTCESSCQTWCTAFPNLQSRAECMFFVGFPTCKFLFYAPSPLEKVTTNMVKYTKNLLHFSENWYMYF